MASASKIDYGRLAALEKIKDADRGASLEADELRRRITRKIKELVEERTHIENAPQVMDQDSAQARYQKMQKLTAQIEEQRSLLVTAKGNSDVAQERMEASTALWEACAKYAGIKV